MTTGEKPPSSRPGQTERLKTESEQIRRLFLAGGDALAVLERRTVLVDRIVIAEFEEHLGRAFDQGVTLVATGGYGRRELFPYSDIDLLVLVEGVAETGLADPLARLLRNLWDVGLRLGHSVRCLKECLELHGQNIEFNISLLDHRLLAGDGSLYEQLAARLGRFYQSERDPLARRLARLARERHRRFHSTIHHLEPNLKEAPGALRDLQSIRWLGRLTGTGSSAAPPELETPWRLLALLRCFLHYQGGRDSNVLTFDAQEEIALQGVGGFSAPEQVMREYFRAARSIWRASERRLDSVESRSNSLLAGFRDWRSRLSNADFTVSRDRALFRAPQRLAVDPDLALRLFELVGRHRVALHGETEQRLGEYSPALAAYFDSTPNLWPRVRALLDLPHAAAALRAMHDTGVLALLFPAWAEVSCYVVRDFHHRYTVDEHTLIALENLERLAGAQEPGLRRFTTLWEEIEHPALVRLALLFHDVGKARPAEDHAEASARAAGAAAARLGMPERERDMLETIIRHHLDLSAAMTARDLDDPATARWLAGRCRTVEILKNLTLLTWADIGAVNPTALSPWRVEQLWRVFLTTHRELTRELETDRITGPEPGHERGEREMFLKGFPRRYLRIHSPHEIDRHLALEAQRREHGVALEIDRSNGAWRLTLLAKDRTYLFASVAGALAGFGMNILKAEAFSNQQGTILDTFSFSDPLRTLELNPGEIDRLRQTLERVVLGRTEVRALLKNRPRPAPPSKGSRFEPRISFDGSASETATLVEIVAPDRPGLLYDLAAALSDAGCNIEVVLVDTEAHKALDVFYVTVNGHKLDADAEICLARRLAEACGR